ncbi:MAG: hypothetical protein HY744_01810 [Deltaproteobacteria bacterium]|nr:hypothetical protein [Deltaproteobacteria bacterium]
MNLNDLVKGMLTQLGRVTSSQAVVGNVRDAGRAKVVPLAKVSIGFGTALGGVGGKAAAEGQDVERGAGVEAGGAGAAIVVEPRAFVVVGEDGIPHTLALKRGRTAVLRHGIELVPEPAAPEGPPELSGGEEHPLLQDAKRRKAK